MSAKQRNFGLDLLRALSIIMVLIAHKIHLPVEIGLVGVQVFFILSGFLIGQILIRDFEDRNSMKTVLNFWKRRWFRTLPLYYMVLIILLLIHHNPFGWKVLIYFFFLQANVLGIDFFHVSWSLVVEEWFYIFLPLSTFIFFKKGISARLFLSFVITLIILFFTVRFLWNYFEKGVIIYQFDCLLLGVLLAVLKTYYKDIYQIVSRWPFMVIGLIAAFFLTYHCGRMSAHSVWDTYYKVTWGFLMSVAIAIVLPFCERSAFINQSVGKNPVAFFLVSWVSILSYSLYLLHPLFYSLNLNLPRILAVILQFVFLFSTAYLVFVFYERPFMNLRDGFLKANYWHSIKFARRI